MTIRLYGSWFSTFARKVAIGLELKGLPYEPIDALTREFRAELIRLNPRAEVPVVTDDGLTVVNSSDILQYLEWRYPDPPLYPASIAERVAARALERLADERFDPIVVDCSFWHWADRDDKPPAGLLEAGQRDLDATFANARGGARESPEALAIRRTRGARVRVVCQSRGCAAPGFQDQRRSLSSGGRLAARHALTSSLCRRRKAHRRFPEDAQAILA